MWNKVNMCLFDYVDVSVLVEFFLVIFYEEDLDLFINENLGESSIEQK